MQIFCPRTERSEPHTGLSSPGVLHWEDEPSKCLALKTSGAYFQETQRTVGNIDSTLREHTQDILCSHTHGKSSNLKGAWLIPIYRSWRVYWTGWRQLELTLRIWTQVVSILWSSFYHMYTGAGKHRFGILSLSYKLWDPAPSPSTRLQYWNASGQTTS